MTITRDKGGAYEGKMLQGCCGLIPERCRHLISHHRRRNTVEQRLTRLCLYCPHARSSPGVGRGNRTHCQERDRPARLGGISLPPPWLTMIHIRPPLDHCYYDIQHPVPDLVLILALDLHKTDSRHR